MRMLFIFSSCFGLNLKVRFNNISQQKHDANEFSKHLIKNSQHLLRKTLNIIKVA